MRMKIDIVDLKKNLQYLDQYIVLRNNYKDDLFTEIVTYQETRNWLQNNSIVNMIATQNKMLLGVVILYIDKKNEVTIFVKEKNKGIGTLLLKEIEKHAIKNGLTYLLSWIEASNKASKTLFIKEKYTLIHEKIKKYNNINYNGNIFKKDLYI